jgi:hypothetical protein
MKLNLLIELPGYVTRPPLHLNCWVIVEVLQNVALNSAWCVARAKILLRKHINIVKICWLLWWKLTIAHIKQKAYLFIPFIPGILVITEVHEKRYVLLIPVLVCHYPLPSEFHKLAAGGGSRRVWNKIQEDRSTEEENDWALCFEKLFLCQSQCDIAK